MHRVSPRITGDGNVGAVSATVAAASAWAKDFFGESLLLVVATTMGRVEGFPVEANSVCQSKAMAGLVSKRVQNGQEKRVKITLER